MVTKCLLVHCFRFIKYPSAHSEHVAPEYPVLQLQFCHPLHSAIPTVLHPQPKLSTEIYHKNYFIGKSTRRASSLLDWSTFIIFLFCDVSGKKLQPIFKPFMSNGEDLIFLFKEGLSIINNWLSFNSNNFFFAFAG